MTKHQHLQAYIASKVEEVLKMQLGDFTPEEMIARSHQARASILMYIRANFEYEELVELVAHHELNKLEKARHETPKTRL